MALLLYQHDGIDDVTVRAGFLRWPAERNCDWDCPWPAYCIDCHQLAYEAMVEARLKICLFIARMAS